VAVVGNSETTSGRHGILGRQVNDGAKEPCMDLGRPIARHRIRRPHEVIDLDQQVTADPDAVQSDAPVADDQPVSPETSEH
jgi:hypothetical protein